MALEEYLLSLAEDAARRAPPGAAAVAQTEREEAVRRMLEFGEKHRLTLGEPITRVGRDFVVFSGRSTRTPVTVAGFSRN